MDKEEVINQIRQGIDIRISKIQSDKEVYEQGIVIWKEYVNRQGFAMELEEEIEFKVDTD